MTIRQIWGPFRSTEEDQWSERMSFGWENVTSPTIEWYFHGVRENGTMTNWKLTYHVRERRFTVHGQTVMDKKLKPIICAPGKESMFLAAPLAKMPLFTGAVTDILRRRLPAEEIARASAASIRLNGNGR